MHIEPNAFRLLDRYGIDACLLQRKTTLVTVLSQLPDWKVAYSDDVAVLFVRTKPLGRTLPPSKQ